MAVLVLVGAGLASCAPAAEEDSAAAPGAGGTIGDITVADAWARAAPAGGNSAAYMIVRNAGAEADRLVSASTDAASMVQIHETVMEDGVAQMVHQPDGVAVPAGASLTLAPGGLHVMLMELGQDLAEGGTVSLELVFETAGPLSLDVPIRAMQGGEGGMEMGGG